MKTIDQELEDRRVKSAALSAEAALDRKGKMRALSNVILNDEFFTRMGIRELYISADFSRAYYGVYSRGEKLVIQVLIKSSHRYREDEHEDAKHQYFKGGGEFCFESFSFGSESEIRHHYEDPFEAAVALASQFKNRNPEHTFILAQYDQNNMKKFKKSYPEITTINRYINGPLDEFLVPIFIIGFLIFMLLISFF